MHITGTHLNYYFVCKRKLWLFAAGIQMEHTSNTVYEGKILHKTAYPERSSRLEEIEIGGCKIDFYDPKTHTVHEIKHSDKIEEAHHWQLRYYIYILKNAGIEDASGIVEYPKLRKKEIIELSSNDEVKLNAILKDIESICKNKDCPSLVKLPYCKNCSYYDFCFCSELEP